MWLSCPFIIFIKYLLFLVSTFETDILLASLAFVDSLKFAGYLIEVQKVELDCTYLTRLCLIAFIEELTEHLLFIISLSLQLIYLKSINNMIYTK